ncbi:MAG: hypothetical protein JXR76_31795 [Deltaproteobacteria bacterium]|nr:hypothetical protein [Deltaproteobacteria bacterium]
MILNGIKLLIHPKNAWDKYLAEQGGHAPNLIAAAFTAATIPAAFVVTGHLLSARLGYAENTAAIQRAAIGFVSICIGALVMIPALALLLLRIGNAARIDMTAEKASAAAMALVWSTWVCGIVMVVPPLLNLRPEYGEFAWTTISLMVAWRVISQTVGNGLNVSRRWQSRFKVESMLAFAILFISIPVLPPLVMRMLVGVTGQIVYGAPPELEWPHPPTPNW